MMRHTLVFLAVSLAAFSPADAQTMPLAFNSDDFVVTPVFNDVAQFTFDIAPVAVSFAAADAWCAAVSPEAIESDSVELFINVFGSGADVA